MRKKHWSLFSVIYYFFFVTVLVLITSLLSVDLCNLIVYFLLSHISCGSLKTDYKLSGFRGSSVDKWAQVGVLLSVCRHNVLLNLPFPVSDPIFTDDLCWFMSSSFPFLFQFCVKRKKCYLKSTRGKIVQFIFCDFAFFRGRFFKEFKCKTVNVLLSFVCLKVCLGWSWLSWSNEEIFITSVK